MVSRDQTSGYAARAGFSGPVRSELCDAVRASIAAGEYDEAGKLERCLPDLLVDVQAVVLDDREDDDIEGFDEDATDAELAEEEAGGGEEEDEYGAEGGVDALAWSERYPPAWMR